MAEEIKRSKVEDDDAFVAETPNTLAWLWATGYRAPGKLDYNCLLRISRQLWETDKIWVCDDAERLFNELERSMSVDEVAKFKASHVLAQEFAFLHLKTRFMRAIERKMNTMTIEELIKWEEEAEKEE